VADRLKDLPGVRVLRADDEAKRIMVEDPEVRVARVERFGEQTFRSDGTLDRAGLAARVFGDEDEVAALNAIVHPAVRRDLRRQIERARADGIHLLVYEAALIYEIEADSLADIVVLVDAPLEARVERVVERDGVSREHVLARAGHQLDPGALRARADYVIENDGDLAHLHRLVDEMYATLVTDRPEVADS
jgi:dephospho-CoA kinase